MPPPSRDHGWRRNARRGSQVRVAVVCIAFTSSRKPEEVGTKDASVDDDIYAIDVAAGTCSAPTSSTSLYESVSHHIGPPERRRVLTKQLYSHDTDSPGVRSFNHLTANLRIASELRLRSSLRLLRERAGEGYIAATNSR
jgi:hypothetical protein